MSLKKAPINWEFLTTESFQLVNQNIQPQLVAPISGSKERHRGKSHSGFIDAFE